MTTLSTDTEAAAEALLPEALRFLKRLVTINSHSLNPDGVNRNAEVIEEQFAPLGFSARRLPCAKPGTGEHLILDSGGDGPVIACISHLDTVFTPEEEAQNQFHWLEEGSRVYGPGTYDIKGGTVMIWMLLRSLAATEPERFRAVRWVLLWDAAEEILTKQFGDLCLELLPPSTRACLVFEGDNQSGGGFGVLRARKGCGRLRIRVSGRGAHAGSRYGEGANAIHQLARLIDRAMALTDLSREVTVNAGVVSGGVATNRVPHEAEALLELRAYDLAVYRSVRDAILAFSGPGEVCAASDGFACQVEVTLLDEVPPWPANARTDRLISFWQGAAAACGLPLEVVQRGGFSDGNWLCNHLPTLDGLGPRGGNAHASERSADGSKLPESVDISSFVPKTVLNTLAVRALLASL